MFRQTHWCVLAILALCVVGGCGPVPQVAAPTLAPVVTPAPPAVNTTPIVAATDLGARLDAYFTDRLAKGTFSGVVYITQGDTVVLRKGYGDANQATNTPNTPATAYRIGNLSRPFAAASILLLQRQGKLDVADSICAYLADCPAAWGPVTLGHLLSDSSGIPSYNEVIEFSKVVASGAPPEDLIAIVRDRPLRFTPGTTWDLSQTNFALLGMVIEQVSGQPYEVFLHDQILTPLGMSATGYLGDPANLATGYLDYGAGKPAAPFDPSAAFAGYGLYSTVDDLYRWDQALFGDELLTPDERAMMHGDYVHIYGWYIGYGTSLSDKELPNHHLVFQGHPWLAYPGFYGSNWSLTDRDVTIIILANQAIGLCPNDDVGAMILAEP